MTENVLAAIQAAIRVPKGREMKFGGYQYRYRSCEDILDAAKPVLRQHGQSVTLTDEIVQIGARIYVKAIATITPLGVYTTAYAREAEIKKGSDEAQITGAASSYARKYALCGLLAIDDGNDADSAGVAVTQSVITDVQVRNIKQLIVDTNSDEGGFCRAFGIRSVTEMPSAKYNTAIDVLNKKKQRASNA